MGSLSGQEHDVPYQLRVGVEFMADLVLTERYSTCINGAMKFVFIALAALFTTALAQTNSPTSTPAHVHPDLQAAAEGLRQGKMPIRASVAPSTPAWVKRSVPGTKGAPDVPVVVINSGGDRRAMRPAILHMHGGGFVMGTAAQYVPALQSIAGELDCVIVTVDYRLAPGTKFPGSLEDNYAALIWLHRNAAELGVDSSRIAVMGESAGGGHAAMLAIAARDRGQVPLLYQALIYPMLDDRTATTHKVPAHLGTLVWTREANSNGWTALLGVPAGSAHVPEGAVPARTANLTGLPPAFIGVGDIDLLVEEDVMYAQRLINAGISVELKVVPGAFHGFDILVPDAPVSKQFRAALVNALRGAFQGVFRTP
jgi:acetyl esterase/lipase